MILCFFFPECLRKSARGEVTVRSPGTGLITINNKSIEYFEHIQDREQVGYTSLSLIYIEDQQSETGSHFDTFLMFIGNINTLFYKINAYKYYGLLLVPVFPIEIECKGIDIMLWHQGGNHHRTGYGCVEVMKCDL